MLLGKLDPYANPTKSNLVSSKVRVNPDFIHVDFDAGKRVLAWRRGWPGTDKLVVVVANFSDFATDNPSSPSAEYRVQDWPLNPPEGRWREITQGRDVPPEWVGREPIFPWEAKVYTQV